MQCLLSLLLSRCTPTSQAFCNGLWGDQKQHNRVSCMRAGMKEEFDEARGWIETSFKPAKTRKDVNLFETTIRVVGGLLSTYALSTDR